MKKRFFALLMSFCMLLSLFPANFTLALESGEATKKITKIESPVEKTSSADDAAVEETKEEKTAEEAEEVKEPEEAEELKMSVTTIKSAPALDGAIAVINGNLPKNAKAVIKTVKLNDAELIKYFGEEKAAAMTDYVTYDIKILVNGEEWQPDETVSVTVEKAGIEPAENEGVGALHVDSKTNETSELDAQINSDGDVSFDTDGFSLFILFTVDFEYEGYRYSIDGYSEILLSELFSALAIEKNAADAVSVVFSDETLIAVEQLEDGSDWKLISLLPFHTDETLTVTFADGEVLEIKVTDATTYTTGTYSELKDYTVSGAQITAAIIDGDVVWNLPSNITSVAAFTLNPGATLTINTDHDFTFSATKANMVYGAGSSLTVRGTGDGTDITFSNGTDITGAALDVETTGKISFNPVTLKDANVSLKSTAGDIKFSGTATLNGTTKVTAECYGTFSDAGAITANEGSSLTVKGTGESSKATLSGTVAVTGATVDVTAVGDVSYKPGTLKNANVSLKSTAGNITVAAATTFTGNTTFTADAAGTLTQNGAITVSNTSGSDKNPDNTSNITYISGGDMTFPNSWTIYGTPTMKFEAGGTFTAQNGNGITLNNSPKIDIDASGDVAIGPLKTSVSSDKEAAPVVTIDTDGNFAAGGHTLYGSPTVTVNAVDMTLTGGWNIADNSHVTMNATGNISKTSATTLSGSAEVKFTADGTFNIADISSTAGSPVLNVNCGGKATVGNQTYSGAKSDITVTMNVGGIQFKTINALGTASVTINSDGDIEPNSGSSDSSSGTEVDVGGSADITFRTIGTEDHNFILKRNQLFHVNSKTATLTLEGEESSRMIFDGGAEWTGDEDEVLGRGTTPGIGNTARNLLADDAGGTVTFSYVDIQNIYHPATSDTSAIINYAGAGSLTLEHVRIMDSYKQPGGTYAGGGIVRVSGGTATASNSLTINDLEVFGTEFYVQSSSVTDCAIISVPADSYTTVSMTGLNMHNNKVSLAPTIKSMTTANTGSLVGILSKNATVELFSDSTFEDNLFNLSGGAVTLRNTSAVLDHITIKNNKNALTNDGLTGHIIGAAMRLDPWDVEQTVTFKNGCVIEGNSSVEGGGAIAVTGKNAKTAQTLNLDLGDTVIKDNKAKSNGGALYIDPDTVTAVNVNGGVIEGNSADGFGGAVFAPATTTLSIDGTEFKGNTAESGGAIYNFAALKLNDCTFDGNKASTDGGALANAAKAATVDVTGGTMTSNEAARGGAIYIGAGTVSVEDTVITENSAVGLPSSKSASNKYVTEGVGGGIYAQSGTLVVAESEKATIYGNFADFAGDDLLALSTATVTVPDMNGKTLAADKSKTAGAWHEDYADKDTGYSKGTKAGTEGIRYKNSVSKGTESPALDGGLTDSSVYTALSLGYPFEKASYTVEYYFDGVQDTTKTYKQESIVGSIVTEYKNWSMGGKYNVESELNFPLKVTANSDENVIKVYYETNKEDDVSVVTSKRLTREGMDDYTLTLTGYVKGKGVKIKSYTPADIIIVSDESGSMSDRIGPTYTQQDLIDLDRETGGQVKRNATVRGFYQSPGGSYILQYIPGDAKPWKIYSSMTATTPTEEWTSLEFNKMNAHTFQQTVGGVLIESLWDLVDQLSTHAVKNNIPYRFSSLAYADKTWLYNGEECVTLTSPTDYDYTGALHDILDEYGTVMDSFMLTPAKGNQTIAGGAFDAALGIQSAYDLDGSKRNLFVIHFGDEELTSGNPTNKINALKDAGATVFMIDCDQDKITTNNWADKSSSNYDAAGNKVADGFHLAASSKEGIQAIFETITNYIQETSAVLDKDASYVDVLSADFLLDDSLNLDENLGPDGVYTGDMIKVYTEKVIGWEEDGTPIFGDRTPFEDAIIKVDPVVNKVSVTGFDYAKYYVSQTKEELDPCMRIVIEFPIVPSEQNKGGIAVLTNDVANSGIFTSEGDMATELDIPRTDEPTVLTLNKVVNGRPGTFDFDVTYEKIVGYEEYKVDDHYIKATVESTTDTLSVAATTKDEQSDSYSGAGTVKQIYCGENAAITIKEKTSGYKITSASYTSDTTTTPVEITDFAEDGSFTVPAEPGITVTVVNEINTKPLTITKIADSLHNENDSFIFRITSTKLDGDSNPVVDMYVTVQGSGSITVLDLPIGEYTVSEVGDWSWRYTPNQASQTFDLFDQDSVTFENELKNLYYFSGSAYAVNTADGVKSN
ncbi:MAG: hypothetical protein KBS74_04715 [Clostridiales bacterium]|nr:hypothetical protein [Candidatus Cacconaster stercorequi]